MKTSNNLKSWIGYSITAVSATCAVIYSIAVSDKGKLWGEIGVSRWMYESTPGFVDILGNVIDAPITDIGAPLLFLAITILRGTSHNFLLVMNLGVWVLLIFVLPVHYGPKRSF